MLLIRILLFILLYSAITHGLLGQPVLLSEAIVEWNEAVLAVAEEEDGFLTLKGLRTATLVHLAMHDAFNAVEHKYTLFSYAKIQEKLNVFVSINYAACVIASMQYPNERIRFEKIRDKWVSHLDLESDVEHSQRFGREVALHILQARENDGWDTEAEYQWHPMSPGVYAEFNEHSGTPEGFIFGAGWGKATPFGLNANNAFVSPPPPEIESRAYTRAFEEVKEFGRFEGQIRTEDQTHLALWWKDFVENSHNRLARSLVIKEQLSLDQSLRLFALLNMSVYDAYVSSFYNKFLYNHWRPYTAIRWASNDNNPLTKEDISWTNTHQHTYAFPSYPSAHGTACAAASVVLADVFGDVYPHTMVTENVDKSGPYSGKVSMDPTTRSFNSFHEAALECSLSRVFLGIHFSYDSLEGNRLGRRVGEYNVSHHLVVQ